MVYDAKAAGVMPEAVQTRFSVRLAAVLAAVPNAVLTDVPAAVPVAVLLVVYEPPAAAALAGGVGLTETGLIEPVMLPVDAVLRLSGPVLAAAAAVQAYDALAV